VVDGGDRSIGQLRLGSGQSWGTRSLAPLEVRRRERRHHGQLRVALSLLLLVPGTAEDNIAEHAADGEAEPVPCGQDHHVKREPEGEAHQR